MNLLGSVGCVATLKAFLAKNPQFGRTTTLKQRVGAYGDDRIFNEDNWVDLDYVIRTINSHKSCTTYNTGLEVRVFGEIDKQSDAIYILVEYHHCFVLLYLHESNTAIIADGSNAFMSDESIENHIRGRICSDILIKMAEFMHQSGVDHCASSAVSIVLELMRLYKRRERLDKVGWPSMLSIPTRMHRSIVNRLHKYESERISRQWANTKKRLFPRCQYCGKAFQTTNRRSVTLHELHCRNRVTPMK